MNKQAAFQALAEEMSHCHLCRHMVTKPHTPDGEFLENDGHGLDTDHPYVNLWNLWQGSLDADILLIGQDFGTWEQPDAMCAEYRTPPYADPTGRRLYELFGEVFGLDLSCEQPSLFFTNMATCYRKSRTSGGMHDGWLPICASRYMARLIRIIRPKIIIVLGQAAFDAMFCLEGMPVRCEHLESTQTDTLAERMKRAYFISCEGEEIRIFPVYHPGANAKRNRTEAQQREDWQCIKQYYDTVT
jgi:DNA polymerase